MTKAVHEIVTSTRTPGANHWHMGNVELHFHLLPGIDDGPSSIGESVELARAAANEGTDTIVATPHVSPQWDTDVMTLPARVAELDDRLHRERISITVLCGGELDCEMVGCLSPASLDLIAQGPPGKRWLLLEAPLTGLDARFSIAADELRASGFGVVVAHPERSAKGVAEDWRVLARELAAGSALQLNAWSLAGLYGDRVRSIALRLLDASPRVAIASDAHGVSRSPALRLASTALAELAIRDPARFTTSNPRSLVERGLSATRLAAVA